MGADEIEMRMRGAVHAQHRLRRAQWLVGGRLGQRLQRSQRQRKHALADAVLLRLRLASR